jgi:hypothetical protein
MPDLSFLATIGRGFCPFEYLCGPFRLYALKKQVLAEKAGHFS